MVAPVIDLVDGVYDGSAGTVGMIRENTAALLASSFPVTPPPEWFTDPGFGGPTPLTVEDDGHVYGHIATWAQSHIGMGGKVHAPKSKSNYAFFATGAVKCSDGSFANVGQITLAGGHASIEASPAEAVRHYDNTASAIMDVAIGEDAYGIWVGGALRPDIDDNKIRTLRASSVSGDWRPINGNLELVAVCAVNVPGFPIPRARVAGGQPMALVAAGVEPLVRQAILDHELNGRSVEAITAAAVTAAVTPFDHRMRLMEDALLDRTSSVREGIDEAVLKAKRMASIRAAVQDSDVPPAPQPQPEPKVEPPTEAAQPEPEADGLEALRARVHIKADSVPVVEPVASIDDLRARVHGTAEEAAAFLEALWADQRPIESTTQELLVSSLRARKDGLTATATTAWKADKRKDAAKKGEAMEDGSFPIHDKRDLEKAIKAIGRAKDPSKAKRHIKKRAKALNATGMLPDDWK